MQHITSPRVCADSVTIFSLLFSSERIAMQCSSLQQGGGGGVDAVAEWGAMWPLILIEAVLCLGIELLTSM